MRAVFVDYRISEEEHKNLEKLNFEVLIVPKSDLLYDAVSGHPDMLIHLIDISTILVHKDMDAEFISKLNNFGYNVLKSKNSLNSKYPFDIILNAVNLENLFIHNITYSDEVLVSNIKHKKFKTVKQGYTKCSTALVTENAVMTSDAGIAKCLLEEGLDVLLLPPGDILLTGLNYGFIGGCCGLLDKRALAFYGHLDNYMYSDMVYPFLKKHKIEPIFLSNGKLNDRGSIIEAKIKRV